MRRLPRVFRREFLLGLRGLGVEILSMILRSIAPLNAMQRSLSSYLLLLWKTKKRKDTNLQKKVYSNRAILPSSHLRSKRFKPVVKPIENYPIRRQDIMVTITVSTSYILEPRSESLQRNLHRFQFLNKSSHLNT